MARPRYQQGQLQQRSGRWILKYWDDRVVDGTVQRIRTTKTLLTTKECPKETDARKEADKFLRGINESQGSKPNSGLTLGEFIEQSYFPRLDKRLEIPAGNELHIEPSTVKGYKDIWKVHVQNNPVAKIMLKDFTTKNGQIFLESLPQHLSHQTHMRVKNFLRGVFTWAITNESFNSQNPMEDTKAGGQTKKRNAAQLDERQRKIQASNEHAYTLEEVAEMLDKLPEPARTVCATAAFTGLTRSELRGLKWADFDGECINVERKVWGTHIGAPKTEAREAGIFVIPVLRQILAKYRKQFPSNDWIFFGSKSMTPLNLDNLSRRDIPEHINGAWFGWHAFRRGLGTRLYEADIDDKTIQAILRHADVSTTQAYYIRPDKKRAAAGLNKLGKTLRSKYGIKA
jgi:integrase